MQNDLNDLLRVLKDAPIDRALGRLAVDVNQRLMDRRAAGVQAWGLRAAAVAVVTMSSVAISAAGTAAAAPERSPFAVWSELAPSTLLGDTR